MTGGFASFLAMLEQARRDVSEAAATRDGVGHVGERDPTVTSLI